MMIQIHIDSMESLLSKINILPNNYLYRGQADAAWGLESSLERIIGVKWSSQEARRFEDFSLKQFCSKFHLYDNENIKPDTKLSWLSVMQHYGVPTRLLDFTESPYVALYFALETYNPQLRKKIALYAIDYSDVMEKSIEYIKRKDLQFKETRETIYDNQDSVFDSIVDRFEYDIAWIAEPKILNARLDRQVGSFVLSGNRGMRIECVLNSDVYNDTKIIKFIISEHLYEGIFSLLRKMNITSKSLYGDLDGLARSIRMEMQVYSA